MWSASGNDGDADSGRHPEAVAYGWESYVSEDELSQLTNDELSRLEAQRGPVGTSGSDDLAGQVGQKTLVLAAGEPTGGKREEPKVEVFTPSLTTPPEATNVVADGTPPDTSAQLQKLWPRRLRAARLKLNLSRTKIVGRLKKLNVEITAEAVKKHEEGKAKPKASTRKAYATIYDCTEDELFG